MFPSAVLFDFDGVIADTENHHVAAWQRTLTALGWQVPDDVAARAAEIDDRLFLTELFAERGIEDGDVEGWVRKKQALTVSLIREAPRVYPGVLDLLKRLQGKVRLAVVSGTWRENVLAVLESTGVAESFELIVAKDDVNEVKPLPEAYLLALDRLGITAAEAVAIEDSPSGLSAARASGIRCLALGHRREFGEWVGDAVYISGIEPVAGVLEYLGLNPAAK
jgi:beta-phosphoglucomutase